MTEQRVLIVTDDLMTDLATRYNLTDKATGWEYQSPNGMINKFIEANPFNSYGTFSRLSLPTNDIEQYPNIAQDIQDFYAFQKSFETETIDEAVARLSNPDN